MKTFLDNTSFHQLRSVLNAADRVSSADRIDAILLLQYAEHIMFSDEFVVAVSNIAEVRDKTASVIDVLTASGCFGKSGGIEIRTVDFSEEEYATFFAEVVPQVVDYLYRVGLTRLKECGEFSRKKMTRPEGRYAPEAAKWAGKGWSKEERANFAAELLHKKAEKAFDYAVATNDSLYRWLKDNATPETQESVSCAIDVLIRTELNEQLGKRHRAFYAPAPQRARVVDTHDHVFRMALEETLEKHREASGLSHASGLLHSIRKYERLPTPILAVHFLRRRKIEPGPMGMLQAARDLRDDCDVKWVRNWLGKWESRWAGSPEERSQAWGQLHGMISELGVRKTNPLWSVLRGEVKLSPDGSLSSTVPVGEVCRAVLALLGRFNKRHVFLSSLYDELVFDKSLGRGPSFNVRVANRIIRNWQRTASRDG